MTARARGSLEDGSRDLDEGEEMVRREREADDRTVFYLRLGQRVSRPHDVLRPRCFYQAGP